MKGRGKEGELGGKESETVVQIQESLSIGKMAESNSLAEALCAPGTGY